MKLARVVLHFVSTLARELADENAYQRHLASHGRSHSAEEWRRFIDGRLKRKYQNAKCC